MSYSEELETITLTAGAAVTQYRAVYVDSNGAVQLSPLAGTNEACIGIAQNAAATGEAVTVAISGVSKVMAAGTVTAGQRVMVATANGEIANFSGATHYIVGMALTSAAAGKLASVLVRPINLVDTIA